MERAWRSVEDGWESATVEIGESVVKKRVVKPSSERNDVEDRLSNCNSKALNAIFGGIDEEQFRRVSACTTTKETWKILEVHYEETESVRAVKLQMLMTQFVLMRMRDDETILEFEGKIRDIANQSANLGDRIPQDQLIKKCQYTRENTTQLRHKQLGHIHARGLHKLVKYGVVRRLPNLTGTVETVCKGCMEGKQHRTSHPALKIITTKQLMELLHIDLMGSVQTESKAGKKYVVVCVDDFTRFTWVKYLREKFEAFKLFVNLCKRLMIEKFDSRSMEGIFVEYSRNNHAYRVFLRSANIVIETVNVKIADQNEDLQVLEDEHVPFIQMEGTVGIVTDISEATSVDKPEVTLVELSIEESSEVMKVSYTETQGSASAKEKASSIRVQKNHPADAIIGYVNEGMKIRGKKKNYGDMTKFVCYTSLVEPRKVEEVLKDEFWIRVMQEDLEQFERNEVWTLVPCSTNLNVIGTKWVFKNKMVEELVLVHSKKNKLRNKPSTLNKEKVSEDDVVPIFEEVNPVEIPDSVVSVSTVPTLPVSIPLSAITTDNTLMTVVSAAPVTTVSEAPSIPRDEHIEDMPMHEGPDNHLELHPLPATSDTVLMPLLQTRDGIDLKFSLAHSVHQSSQSSGNSFDQMTHGYLTQRLQGMKNEMDDLERRHNFLRNEMKLLKYLILKEKPASLFSVEDFSDELMRYTTDDGMIMCYIMTTIVRSEQYGSSKCFSFLYKIKRQIHHKAMESGFVKKAPKGEKSKEEYNGGDQFQKF
ncbi:hypothetical protein H6P81_007281 [Aristolochia fimbriata]|uniref:Polyprotein n=1 Tax=Aristolochia fimbriata TaxID=158543 RepID=A0AAV7F352_ARIFI|nr:hypothetical protein H6P81_007281 [Aristolochia fimbriata]